MLINWVIAAISIIGAILNIKKNKWGFILWIIGNIGWIVIDIIYGLYEQIPIWILFTFTSVYGFKKWSDEEKITNNG
jgi:nicotinamide riboside transporter PnuC